MHSTLLGIMFSVCFIGVICVYFINGRSVSKSIGGICAIIIACALSYQLFIPLSGGVSIHRLTQQIMVLAFAPLAVLLVCQAVYYATAGARLRRSAQTGGEPKQAKDSVAFAKRGRKTGKDRLDAIVRGADGDEARKREEEELAKAQEKQEKAGEESAPTQPATQTKAVGHERLEAMLKAVSEEEALKAEEPTEPEEETEPSDFEELSVLLDYEEALEAIEPEESEEEEPEEEITEEEILEENILEEEILEEEILEEEISPEISAGRRMLDKAGQMKANGGFKLAAALYEEYLKNPSDEQSETTALQGLLDCYISLKQNTEARSIARILSERLDEEGSNKMRLLLKLLNR